MRVIKGGSENHFMVVNVKPKREVKKKIKEMAATTKYDKLFIKLSKSVSVHDTEYAHIIEDKIFWLFVSDVANGKLKPDETIEIAKKINDVIIEGRKDAGRWFA
jgi:glycine/serine hydroxymethyltransferase